MKESAQVVLINKEGLVLAVSRKDNHEDFGLPGGKVDPGETPEQAAIRETKEETGLDIHDLQLVFAMFKNGYMGYTYLAKYSGEINHNEPHVVKWDSFYKITQGSFGKFNQLVAESLEGMGIQYLKEKTKKDLLEETYQEFYKSIVESQKNGKLTPEAIRLMQKLIKKILEEFKFPIKNKCAEEDLISFAFWNCVKYFDKFKDTGDAKKCYMYFRTVSKHAMFSS